MSSSNLRKCGIFIIFTLSFLVILYKISPSVILPVPVTQEESQHKSSTQSPWMDVVPPGSCECHPDSVLLKNHFPKDQFDKVSQRRKTEFEKHKNRTQSELTKVLLALPNSPLQYPIHGFTLKPLKSSPIPGLALYAEEQSNYKVTLKVSKGIFSADDSHRDITVTGNGRPELTLESSSLKLINTVLAKITYSSTIYHVHTADLASFTFEKHEAMFPIVIRQPPLPVMFDIGTDINSQVTIAIKTFLRYDNLKVLLNSIRTFYPKMTVIIADDSFERENINGENIQQYFMPPAQGWFAGRNLAVSQVATKYFLWADDDFLFTKDTKIENFVEVMEAFPELDVVGGSVKGNQFFFSIEYDEGEESEGGCLYRKSGKKFHALPGYPQCFLVNGVVNFFLARADSIRKSRFDPLLKRVAHSEWFMDGLGSLMVATCSDVSINHQQAKNTALYNKYRRAPDNSETVFKYQLHFFKNNLKCIKYE